MASVKVADIMSKNVLTVSPSTSLRDAAAVMLKRNVGCVVVMEDDKCVGILTERDFLRLFYERVDAEEPVEKYMSKNVITIRDSASVNEAKNIMVSQRIRHLPVIDYSNRLIGILSMRDVFERIQTVI
ncbi:MAG TPA: CBS domain-containing protein [Candidatus Caldiarchaeum subterraneum]|uniref:CBS domain-containing protein n=1 Tax=Caldiarchaeum subterraneum TaxID=311458 RepID=A0A832ZUG7_CALS0|nr:CBS domain-containing protein [Candidatus Caldarchaeum subterraneum]